MKIKVLIADDNSFIREGMKIILSSFEEFEVVATVADGAEAVDYCLKGGHDVDVALLDVRMPNMNGVEATRRIAELTSVKPLILTTFDDDEFVLEAVRAGARGYLLKNNDPERIRDAIRSVCNDHHVLQDAVLDKIRSNLSVAKPSGASSPHVKTDVAAGAAGPRGAGSGGAARPGDSDAAVSLDRIDRSQFTERELDVMAQIARGLSNKEISKKLFISEGTTANYITSILNKTGLEHRTQIAIYVLTGEARPSGE